MRALTNVIVVNNESFMIAVDIIGDKLNEDFEQGWEEI